MVKKRRSSAKAALGQQRAELKRSARGSQFIGDRASADEARAARRAKVFQMQAAARAAAVRAREAEEPREQPSRWDIAGQLVRDTTRLAGTVAALPFRIASIAAGLPVRVISAMWFRPREA